MEDGVTADPWDWDLCPINFKVMGP